MSRGKLESSGLVWLVSSQDGREGKMVEGLQVLINGQERPDGRLNSWGGTRQSTTEQEQKRNRGSGGWGRCCMQTMCPALIIRIVIKWNRSKAIELFDCPQLGATVQGWAN